MRTPRSGVRGTSAKEARCGLRLTATSPACYPGLRIGSIEATGVAEVGE